MGELSSSVEAYAPTPRVLTCAIIIPVLNQWAYTQQCLEHLLRTLPSGVQVILINNGSQDETAEKLSEYRWVDVVSNPTNLGCARAWNQGIDSSPQATWRIFLNNDVLLSANWLDGLMDAAESLALDIVCPAMREGPINYSLEDRASFVTTRMRSLARLGMPHGVCFAVRNTVFETIGRFDEAFRVGQFEDTDFFRRASASGFSSATVGTSFIHHFSSITQNALSKKRVGPYEAENRAYFRKKWNLHWFRRKLEKLQAARRLSRYIRQERALAGSMLIDRSI